MNWPPSVVDLRVEPSDGRPHHLWLPVFLLWPLALALGVLVLVLTVLVDVALLIAGQRYHHYTILVAKSFAALTETRGMVVRIHADKTAVDMTVK